MLQPAAWAEAPLAALFAAMLLTGAGIGLATNAALTLLQSNAETREMGRATAAHQFYRNMGFTLGAALGGTVILFVVNRQIGDTEAVRELLAGNGQANLDGTASAIGDGFTAAALVGTVIASLGLVPLLGLRRRLAPARVLADRARYTPKRYAP